MRCVLGQEGRPERDDAAEPEREHLLPAPLASTSEPTGAAPVHSGGAPLGIPADSAGRLVVREPDPLPPEPVATDHATARRHAHVEGRHGLHGRGRVSLGRRPAAASRSPNSLHAADSRRRDQDGADRHRGSRGGGPHAARVRLRRRSRCRHIRSSARDRDYYGHVLVWPNGATYRVLAPGSLRAMFAERRADVSPLLRAKVTPGGAGTLLDHKTLRNERRDEPRRALARASHGSRKRRRRRALLPIARRLVGAEPSTEACHADKIPLAARYKWATSGSISFVATSFVEKKDLPLGYLFVPPAGASFSPGELPPPTSGIFLNREDLSKFRSRAVHVATSPHAPGEGVTADNQTTELQYLLIDSVPVAWVRPKSTQYVIGPPPGHYSIAWRDFFGTAITPAVPTDLPALVRVGHADVDAGARGSRAAAASLTIRLRSRSPRRPRIRDLPLSVALEGLRRRSR